MNDQSGHNFDLKEDIRSFWSARAAEFDQEPPHLIEDRYGMPEWQEFLRAGFGLDPLEELTDLDVLDIACGTGEVSRALLSLGAIVTGVDFSEAMLDQARAKLTGKRWTPMLADAESLIGVTDNSFDYAVTRHLVWTLTEPETAFANWRRVLRPGGQLLIIDGNWMQELSLAYRLRRWIASKISPETPIPAELRAQDNAIRARLPFRNGLVLSDLQVALEKAGFGMLEIRSVDRLYGAGMRGWPLATRLRQSAENRFALICAAV